MYMYICMYAQNQKSRFYKYKHNFLGKTDGKLKYFNKMTIAKISILPILNTGDHELDNVYRSGSCSGSIQMLLIDNVMH